MPYLTYKTNIASGLMATGDPATSKDYITKFLISDVFGTGSGRSLIPPDVGGWSTDPQSVFDNSITGICPSWQIDLSCFGVTNNTTAQDWLDSNGKYNLILFSHGRFEVGLDPSGIDPDGNPFHLSGDAYVKIPNTDGGVDMYHTSGMLDWKESSKGQWWGNGLSAGQGHKITWKFTTPTGLINGVSPYGVGTTLANGESRNIFSGNLGIVLDAGPNPGDNWKGAGYTGAPGHSPWHENFTDTCRTGLWKNGVAMTSGDITGAKVPHLDDYLVNADAATSLSSTPVTIQEGHFFTTGWVGPESTGLLLRTARQAGNPNLITSPNAANDVGLFTFSRIRQSGEGSPYDVRRDPVGGNWKVDYGAVINLEAGQGTAINVNPMINDVAKPYSVNDFKPITSGRSTFNTWIDGAHATDWQTTAGSSACGDPHITPLFGEPYELE